MSILGWLFLEHLVIVGSAKLDQKRPILQYIGHMFGYEHERVCFAHIGECDGGMYATISIVHISWMSIIHGLYRCWLSVLLSRNVRRKQLGAT